MPGTHGQLMKKGVNFSGSAEGGGGGSANIQEVAYATFEQKSQAEKDNGTAWFIPDVPVMPNGRTATPNDVQTWLACANITDKAYTTVSQVLSDTTTLTALINDNNASDYMARSTTWATTICANQTAMTLIGANNYCADAVLADSTWLEAVGNSAYMESVLNVKVPTMTSNTTPSGEVIAGSSYETNNEYKAFDGNDSSQWWSSVNTNEAWIGYIFANPVKIYRCSYIGVGDAVYLSTPVTFVMQSSSDGNTWSYITDNLGGQDVNSGTASCINPQSRKYYRMSLVSGNNRGIQAKTLQFYGREDV